jgi:hypothetical protein
MFDLWHQRSPFGWRSPLRGRAKKAHGDVTGRALVRAGRGDVAEMRKPAAHPSASKGELCRRRGEGGIVISWCRDAGPAPHAPTSGIMSLVERSATTLLGRSMPSSDSMPITHRMLKPKGGKSS